LKKIRICLSWFIALITFSNASLGQTKIDAKSDLKKAFQYPPQSAKPWVFWYWMNAAVSKAAITADLEAMKQAGIGGAYLMPLKGATNPPIFEPVVEQLTPEWWTMIKHAFKESERLGIEIGMNACDGFATAGGPWITPELSMQKVVWSQTKLAGGQRFNDTLATPEAYKGYYKDIAILAYPTPVGTQQNTYSIVPKVTTNKARANAQILATRNNKEAFKSTDPVWVQYAFNEPFTCRSIIIKTDGKNYYSNRLQIEASDDGDKFRKVVQLEPPRQGWQDYNSDVTHSIPTTTAKFFRFKYDKEGAEPGAEDIDAAKWKPALALREIVLSSAARIHQYEGKTGEVWRISERTTTEQIPAALCVPQNKMVNITNKFNSNGRLIWDVPAGDWTILRIGHTSTGTTNYIGGKGLGLECDKFNPEAIRLQFDKWFAETIRQAGPDLAKKVLKVFHVDSWECGSQNWSPVFREEFTKRRGYDLMPYLPAMAGIPVESVEVSERFLSDVRQTIAELVDDKFYKVLKQLAHEKGAIFTSECVAPTMMSDGLQHFATVDIPMGEFWLRSPTHDKPNDMLDAISGGHIYGKPIIQSEAYTELHMGWHEYPGMLKAMGDRNFALGVNKFVFHVFTLNPWMDRKPGMTLGLTGLFFQRDQTWWKQGREWMNYIQRSQALLQLGKPVADVAVFIGEETPRRAVLPDRLVPVLPGIFGQETVESERRRLANIGQPVLEMPPSIWSTANTAHAEDWMIDPLHGYAYDSFNPDALLRLSKVKKGKVEFAPGTSYGLLVFPGTHKMAPLGKRMSTEVATRVNQLVRNGATVLINEEPTETLSLHNAAARDERLNKTVDSIFGRKQGAAIAQYSITQVGKGRVIKGPFIAGSFNAINITKDLIVKDSIGNSAKNISWTHRTGDGFDMYFISNQDSALRTLDLSLRVSGRVPELWDAVTGTIAKAKTWQFQNGRTLLPVQLPPNGSVFIVLQQAAKQTISKAGKNWIEPTVAQEITGEWTVTFDTAYGGPAQPVSFNNLTDWSKHSDSLIRYYSGTASYSKTFSFNNSLSNNKQVWLNVGKVANIAQVTLNGINCGVAWTAPYRVDITKALKPGENKLKIEVANTWHNRMIGDQRIPEDKRITQTTATFRLQGRPLLEAGLLGPVNIEVIE
jgi:hypothetical protein